MEVQREPRLSRQPSEKRLKVQIAHRCILQHFADKNSYLLVMPITGGTTEKTHNQSCNTFGFLNFSLVSFCFDLFPYNSVSFNSFFFVYDQFLLVLVINLVV